jgi:hypothetical protein
MKYKCEKKNSISFLLQEWLIQVKFGEHLFLGAENYEKQMYLHRSKNDRTK